MRTDHGGCLHHVAARPPTAAVPRVARAGVLAVALLAGSLAPAKAALIVNKDSTSYTVSIEDGNGRESRDIAAGGRLEDVCVDGCIVILDGVRDGVYRLPEGNEMVTIEDGVLFYDGAMEAKAAAPE